MRELAVARMVLVVDDDPLVLEITAAMLEDLGCDVLTAASAQEALRCIAKNISVEVLITDVNMPGIGGYELAREAQSAGIQVILLSGREVDGHGFPLIRKPFREADLERTMRRTTGLC